MKKMFRIIREMTNFEWRNHQFKAKLFQIFNLSSVKNRYRQHLGEGSCLQKLMSSQEWTIFSPRKKTTMSLWWFVKLGTEQFVPKLWALLTIRWSLSSTPTKLYNQSTLKNACKINRLVKEKMIKFRFQGSWSNHAATPQNVHSQYVCRNTFGSSWKLSTLIWMYTRKNFIFPVYVRVT